MNDFNDKQTALSERQQFYSTVFKNDFERLTKRSKKLWPVEAYSYMEQTLKNLDFAQPHKTIQAYPRILEFSKDTIQAVLTDFLNLGFTKPVKLLENSPSLLGYPLKTIKSKIKAIKKLKFNDPTKLISRYPSILTLSKVSVKKKIKWLKKCGFSDPIKLIARQPQILGLCETTLNKKIVFFKRVLAKSSASAIELLEYIPVALTMALKRHSLICRYIYSKALTFSYNLYNKLSAKIKQYITAQTVAEDPKLQHYYNRYYGIA